MLRKLLAAFALLQLLGCCSMGDRTEKVPFQESEVDSSQIKDWRRGGSEGILPTHMTPEKIHGGIAP